MSLVDRTNETILLSLEDDVSVLDFSSIEGYDGYSAPISPDIDYSALPTVLEPASLSIDADGDSSQTPDSWIWFSFFVDDEPAYRLTYEEAEKVYDRLGRILGK